MTRIVVVAAACAGVLGARWAESRSAQRKMDAIEHGQLRPGSSQLFTPGEINSWVRERAGALAPYGLRDVRLELETGRVIGTGQIDFAKLRQRATGEAPGWISKELLSGERPVTVTVRVESRAGRARLDVERVEISGVPMEGPALDYLIHTYLVPATPEVKVDEWFSLDSRVDRVAVTPHGVLVSIGRD
jgi:hypothetical protein